MAENLGLRESGGETSTVSAGAEVMARMSDGHDRLGSCPTRRASVLPWCREVCIVIASLRLGPTRHVLASHWMRAHPCALMIKRIHMRVCVRRDEHGPMIVIWPGYTSILHADSNPMALAVEHRETEGLIRSSGVPFVLLRNGWYTENYTDKIAAAIERGVVLGAAANGRISSAARADYAAAAAVTLASRQAAAGKVYELAGDDAYTLAELAAEIARQSGKSVVYRDLPEADYKTALHAEGLPEVFAGLYAESDVKAANGALHDESGQLSALIGRPTTTMAQSVAAALALVHSTGGNT